MTRTDIRVHFWHKHFRETIVILAEVNPPRPQCPLCNMLVLWWSLNGSHKHTAQCKNGAEQKGRRLVVEEEIVANSKAFRAYGRTLDMVP